MSDFCCGWLGFTPLLLSSARTAASLFNLIAVHLARSIPLGWLGQLANGVGLTMARADAGSHMLLRRPDIRPMEDALGCRERALSAKTRSADRCGLSCSSLERVEQTRRTSRHLQRRATFEDGLDQPREGLTCFRALVERGWLAPVAPERDGRLERDAGEQGRTDLFGEAAPAPAAEQLIT